MGLKTFFGFGKKRHTFDDSDREQSGELRRLRQQIERTTLEMQRIQEEQRLEQERANLERLRDVLYGSDDEPEEQDDVKAMLLPLLMKFLGGDQQGQPATPPKPAAATLSYSDEDIKRTWAQLPRIQKKAILAMPEQLIRQELANRFHADPESIERAVVYIKQQS